MAGCFRKNFHSLRSVLIKSISCCSEENTHKNVTRFIIIYKKIQKQRNYFLPKNRNSNMKEKK